LNVGNWKKVRNRCLNTVGCNLKKPYNMYKKACSPWEPQLWWCEFEELSHFACPVVPPRQLDDQEMKGKGDTVITSRRKNLHELLHQLVGRGSHKATAKNIEVWGVKWRYKTNCQIKQHMENRFKPRNSSVRPLSTDYNCIKLMYIRMRVLLE
jgi:hypothetical protein